MLRDLERTAADGPPTPMRKGEIDPADSVFVVLLHEDRGDHACLQVGAVCLSLGEAQGMANRFATEGHKAHHGWQYAIVQEYETGQPSPRSARHGGEYYRPKPVVVDPQTRMEELELELQKLRAQMGQQTTVGATVRLSPIEALAQNSPDPRQQIETALAALARQREKEAAPA